MARVVFQADFVAGKNEMATTTAVDYSARVNYKGFDSFKVDCQKGGKATESNLRRNGFEEEAWSRGESAYVVRMPGKRARYLATVEEGLGTKNISADRMADQVSRCEQANEMQKKCEIAELIEDLTGRSFFREVAQCNVAMSANDIITVGADPLTFMLHLAVESADWFKNDQRWKDVIEGTRRGCDLAGCSWGGGETSVLRKIIVPGASLLSGSMTGFISCHKRLINPANIQDGDVIFLFDSSGPHSNGYTMLWDVVAPRLSEGYLTRIPGDNRTFGEAILAPTKIYAHAIRLLSNAGIRIHYAVNITGHGWAKLMRASQPFAYVIGKLPRQQPVFGFIQEHNPIDTKQMYHTFNMGAGFAIYVHRKDVKRVHAELGEGFGGYNITEAGWIEKSSVSEVLIEPLGIKFGPEELAIR